MCVRSPSCRILASCTELMQAIKVLVLASKDLQRDIVEGSRVSGSFFLFVCYNYSVLDTSQF